jgi:mannose-6-phosphate isomerase
VHRAAEHFPDDVGVTLAVLLNPVRLEPGQAIFLGAGNVHAYLRGMGVEVMASSDNVLRCGLTPKHIDVPELMAITDFRELDDPIWPERDGRYVVTVPDFVLDPVAVDGVRELPGEGARIVVVTEGTVQVGELALGAGQGAFVTAGAAAQLDGCGQAFVVSGAQGDGVSLAPK